MKVREVLRSVPWCALISKHRVIFAGLLEGTVLAGATKKTLMTSLFLVSALLCARVSAQSPDDLAYGKRLYADKAQCSYCHGWAADGAGDGQSNGSAANLRQTRLNRAQLIEIILCGRPGTPMPRFDEGAYGDRRCYGMTEADLGSRTPSLPPASTLQRREVEALVDYLLARVVGRGAATLAECEDYFGKGDRGCREYAAKP